VKLKILQTGEKVLRQAARVLTANEIRGAEIQQLIELMRETMRDAPGVGLAAPQVGVPFQVAVIEDREEYLKDITAEVLAERGRRPVPFQVIINPAIRLSGVQAEFFEGCLSVAGFCALVPRASRVHVEALNERAEPVVIDAEGWHARILQHEIDHLQGALYVDRMRARSFTTNENLSRYWKNKSMDEVRAELGVARERG
jgi:peptide deformylase